MISRLTKEEYNALNKKKGKYGNEKIECDGYPFDSKAEYNRYLELKIMRSGGQIMELKVHPRFRLEIRDEYYCTYIADFSYMWIDHCNWGRDLIVEDVKAIRTKEYQLKKKALWLIKRIKITEIDVLSKTKRKPNLKRIRQ